MNKIYIEENIIGKENRLCLMPFVTINPYVYGDFPERRVDDIHVNNFPEVNTIFMNQKYDITIKEAKKSNKI